MPDDDKKLGIKSLGGVVNHVKQAEERLGERKSDIDGLPEGHPLRRAIEEAKQRYEEKQALAEETKRQREEDEARRNKRKLPPKPIDRKESEQAKVAKELNRQIEQVALVVEQFGRALPTMQNKLHGIPGMTSRMQHLQRLSIAFHRGITDLRVKPNRIGGLN